MISIRQSISKLEQQEELMRIATASYAISIEALEMQTLDLAAEIAEVHRRFLRQVREQATESRDPAYLFRSAGEVREAARVYRERSNAAIEERERHLRDILASLADAARLISQRNDHYGTQLRQFTGGLSELAQLRDLGQIRTRLTHEVTQLRDCVEAMVVDNEQAAGAMRQEIEQYRQRLAEAEAAVLRDPLTGLGNRTHAAQEFDRRARTGQEFCLILADIQRFRRVNERVDKPGGDQVLKQFGGRLAGEMRPTDTVCRWEADQFVILADCSYSDGMRRAYQMGPRLRGRYQVTVEGAERVVDVVARLGVGAYRTGSTIGELIATANSALGRSTTA